MRLVSAHRPSWSNAALAGLALAVTAVALLWTAAGARGAEILYWNNYSATPPSIALSNIDGSGGGPLNSTGAELENPEGMAIDTLGIGILGPILPQRTVASAIVQPGIRMSTRPFRAVTVGIGSPGT